MIKTTGMLLDEYQHYSNPQAKIRRLVDKGELFPLTKGLYETDLNAPTYALAGVIYSPSYLSFDFALAYHGLIPEAVYLMTSATFEKRKKKSYENHFGRYTYRDVPSKVYPYGQLLLEEGDYLFWIATAEKALCDKLYTLPPVGSQSALEQLLFEDLRLDEVEFEALDYEGILKVGDLYGSTNVKLLMKYLRRRMK